MIAFRNLLPHEIEVRVSRCTEKGATFLLYKDARCDMAILDETVGPQNWQRKHDDHNGNLFCSVGINVAHNNPGADPMWVWKEDAGAESNTEAEKGHASDSFKRACVNWGIGRELYTKILIFIPGITKADKGKHVLAEPFFKLTVEHVAYEDKKITELVLCDKSGNVAFDMNRRIDYGKQKTSKDAPPSEPKAPPKHVEGAKKLDPAPDVDLPWDEPISCEECGCLIVPVRSKGQIVSVDEQVAKSRETFKKILCPACIKNHA